MVKGINVLALSETSLTNLNSGEGGSNIIDIKQYKKDNDYYPYVSGQAMRYYIKSALRRISDITSCIPDNNGETCGNIKECEICDLFGYMTTVKGKGAITRVSPVKVSTAMGLLKMSENSNIDMLTRRKMEDEGKSSGDIVNVELATNIYRYGVSIDIERVGTIEKPISDDMLKHSVILEPQVDESVKKARIKKLLLALRNITDYSKQSRLLTDFTPDVALISLDKVYSHRLQKAFEIDDERCLNISKLTDVVSEVIGSGSTVIFGAITGCIKNLDEVEAALRKFGVERFTVKEAFDKAIQILGL